jgi:multicomponent Na+:H+ antiporter subunit B
VRLLAFLSTLFVGSVLFYSALDLPPVGSADSVPATHVSPHYTENTLKDANTPNIVTTILADYRGFDTLGETTVILTAGLACLLILGVKRKETEEGA